MISLQIHPGMKAGIHKFKVYYIHVPGVSAGLKQSRREPSGRTSADLLNF